MKELQRIDAESLRSALELYIREITSSKKCDELAIYYSDMLDEEMGVKGISCEEKIPTTSIKLTPFENELALMQASCEQESINHMNKAESIRKMYRFDERIKSLNKREKVLINDVYFLGVTQKEIAEQKEKSQKTISEYVSYAIKKMSEVDL